MDKKVVFAVAGSGKTKLIIDNLNEETSSLIITYTTSNYENLKERISKRFGFFPANIKLYTYFTFLYSFCYKPFCHDLMRTKGINYFQQPNQYSRKDNRDYYVDQDDKLFFSRISKFLLENHISDVLGRISKYFNNLYIDEIQDFAANDFNFILALAQANIQLTYVGDFYQHTFDTSRDAGTRKNLHADYLKYQQEFIAGGIDVDTISLLKSWRCNSTVTEYIFKYLKIPIESNRSESTLIKYITDDEEIYQIYNDDTIIKLFYQKHYDYCCYSKNWGDCKGEDKYYNVCVILNDTTHKKFVAEDLHGLPASTKNKLYVAISRAKNDLYFIPEKLLKKIVR